MYSSPKKFGGKLFVKQNGQKDILSCSSPRPSTTYLQAPKSTPDYFQAERSFSGNRQVILKTEYFLLLEFDYTFCSVFYCYVISSVTFKPK